MTVSNVTYECEICLNINHASKLHCSTCGTTPKQYSILGMPSKATDGWSFATMGLEWHIPVVIARGADRVEWHHTSRVYLRTVPADYYATPE